MKAAVLLAEGFEEIEFSTIVDILRRAGVEVVIGGLKKGETTGAYKIRMIPDVSIDKIEAHDLDAVILPGGSPGVINLEQDKRVIRLVKEMLTGAHCIDNRVVVDGKIVTSQGPGTAMEFSMKLAEILVGKPKVEEVNKGVLAQL